MSSSNNRSAFEAIPGKDALLEYQSKSYPAKTYVERNGLVYKSLTATTNTFISSQWELIADLREVRVPNIPSRNALTGNTPTSGTTGIRIPILDNTNVLVVDAFNDPQVAKHIFARYNYNQTNDSWLLLQAGTGATNSNVNDYNLLINKKPIVSGVTVTAGTGLGGGGSVLGTAVAPFAAGGVITISHADTSSQATINNSGYAYIQSLRFDTFGHVTGASSSTWVHPSGLTTNIINTGTTYLQSINLSNGHVIGVTSSPWIHPDTSSQASSNNSGNVFIQSIQLDTDGHVTGINTGVAASGGSGSALKVNGDFGGVITMASGGTLIISGGTNISTIRSGNANNTGLRINLNPAGSANQIQINNGGALSASANLTFTGGTTLVSNNFVLANSLKLTYVPVSGSSADQILTRNTSTGVIQQISLNAFAALPLNAIQYRTANGFGGNSNWLFDPANQALTLGSRTGSTGQNSIVIGTNNSASIRSIVIGLQNKVQQSIGGTNFILGVQNVVTGNSVYSMAVGQLNKITGATAGNFAFGSSNVVTGGYSSAFGSNNFATALNSFAIGTVTRANAQNSFAGGRGIGGFALPVFANGLGSFNFSTNNGSQSSGFGALADNSVILGGLNNNIAVGNTGAAIIAGNTVNLTGSSYQYTAAVSNLAIMASPASGVGTDNVLVRNSTNGIIKTVSQSTLGASPAGSSGSIQIKSVSNTFASTANLYFSTGTSQLVTSNLNIATLPVSGTTGNFLLTRNSSTGNVERLSITDLPKTSPAGSNSQIQFNNGGAFGSRSDFYFDTSFGVSDSPLYLGTVSPSTNAFFQMGNQSAVGNNSALLLEGKNFSSNMQLALKSNITGSLAPGQVNQITGSGDIEIYAGSNLYIGNYSPGVNNIILSNLPTSASGLPSGAIWRNGTVINIVP